MSENAPISTDYDARDWAIVAALHARWGGLPGRLAPHIALADVKAALIETRVVEDGLHPCQRKPHYGEPCECEARLAQVVTHTRASTGGMGPDFCSECSQAISEWVPWPCEKAAKFPYWREGETGVFSSAESSDA